MSRIAFSQREVAMSDLRRRHVPILSTLAAGLLALLPIVAGSPLVPDFAFLVLLAWRLLRPEIWTAVMALPLGFYNDLIAGHPLGQSMALWTLLFLLLDFVDTRLSWRDYWMDWIIAAMAILLTVAGGWYVARLMGSAAYFSVMWPHILLSIFAFPLVARIVLALDRWRLSR